MTDEPRIYQSEINTLALMGYRVVDLNADAAQPRVRGPNWIVYAPDDTVITHEWREVDAWIAARIYSRFSPLPY